MTLRERVVHLKAHLKIDIAIATLQRYYKAAGITYRKVDLFSTRKLAMMDKLRAE